MSISIPSFPLSFKDSSYIYLGLIFGFKADIVAGFLLPLFHLSISSSESRVNVTLRMINSYKQ